MAETLYKVLGENAEAVNGGNAVWNTNGKWMPPIEGELEPCRNGYHLCRREHLVAWLGPVIWRATYRGELIDDGDKVVVREARLVSRVRTWNEKTARLFAADCAERALERVGNADPRSIEAVRIARLFAVGEATREELDAASDAARDAASDAARDAERQWQTDRLFEYMEGCRG
jgi:hypothetical protein